MAFTRAWCFTMWEESDVSRLRTIPKVCALVVGQEVAPTTGKLHFQGYVRFEEKVRLSWWKNMFPTAHVEPRKGKEWQAAEYCRKEGTIIYDYGCQVKESKTGDKVVDCLNMLEAGANMGQLYRFNRVFYFHNRRKLLDVHDDIKSWRETGVDFLSGDQEDK